MHDAPTGETPHFSVVDLGTKTGGALDVFRRRADTYFKDAECAREDCLGVDFADKYADEIRKKGYQFSAADVTTCRWPTADFFLAFDFLEHLPDKEVSDVVLRQMLTNAKRGVWLKMPSFEQDATGEGQLKRYGLRFTWSYWSGHPSHYLVEDAMRVITDTCPNAKVKHKHQRIIKHSRSRFVVPINAPIDTTEYSEDLGPKPDIDFNPHVIGCHELIVNLE
jgi:hypothetical protein